MIIPKKIKIGAYEYKIIYTEDHARIGSFFGEIDNETQKIFLTSERHIKQQAIEQAFLHEILHGIWKDKGLHQSDLKDKEEQIVTALSLGLYQVLIDNKLLK